MDGAARPVQSAPDEMRQAPLGHGRFRTPLPPLHGRQWRGGGGEAVLGLGGAPVVFRGLGLRSRVPIRRSAFKRDHSIDALSRRFSRNAVAECHGHTDHQPLRQKFVLSENRKFGMQARRADARNSEPTPAPFRTQASGVANSSRWF